MAIPRFISTLGVLLSRRWTLVFQGWAVPTLFVMRQTQALHEAQPPRSPACTKPPRTSGSGRASKSPGCWDCFKSSPAIVSHNTSAATRSSTVPASTRKPQSRDGPNLCIKCFGEDGPMTTLHCGVKIHDHCLLQHSYYYLQERMGQFPSEGMAKAVMKYVCCPAKSQTGCYQCLSPSELAGLYDVLQLPRSSRDHDETSNAAQYCRPSRPINHIRPNWRV